MRLFIDATDTWFVGHGPPLAAKGTDKEGLYRRRVGIVLLCDQRGFPLRWQTLTGTFHDATALLDMAKLAAGLDWVTDQPVVLDRAVGNARAVQTLTETGLRFVTALPWIEFASSEAPIPWEKVSALQAAALAPGITEAAMATVGTAPTPAPAPAGRRAPAPNPRRGGPDHRPGGTAPDRGSLHHGATRCI